MESDDLNRIERRARRAYEATRVARAAVAFAPVLLLMVVAGALGHQFGYAVAFGTALFVLGVVLLWYGRNLRRAVLPGVLAGLVPLVFALCGKFIGHACMGDSWGTLCVAACFVGGVIAGVVVDYMCLRGHHRVGFWLAASGIGLLTGAMGCTCAGVLGLAGLAVGFALTAVPGFLVFQRRRA
jgi:hypothetical protein